MILIGDKELFESLKYQMNSSIFINYLRSAKWEHNYTLYPLLLGLYPLLLDFIGKQGEAKSWR